MDASDPESQTDPITAALPPNSDYITYLTILEYQLTPDRVPTLTKHLVEDDGTLAKEIGWDLVKIVLPLLQAAPEGAARCLEVVARRGNPREVVVRVAEALEMLGTEDGNDADSNFAEQPDPDPMPTFEGEAARIHLGQMKLEGMSSPPEGRRKPDEKTLLEEQQDQSSTSSTLGKQFSSLLSMLALLHSRIKTQYPSRFLATSLPAALAAYRRITITSDTTQAFLTLLGKLSGARQRPTLPPRSSTASAKHLQALPPTGTEVYAPLPDPEGGSEENAKAPSDLEKSIVQRLLQAVALEVLEEYLLASATTMEWSTRLYEKRAPKRALPVRTSRLKAWQNEQSLSSQDAIMKKFLGLAKDLGLRAEHVFRSTNLPLMPGRDTSSGVGAEEEEDEEKSEFPTAPSQIPYPHLGSLFLFLASRIPVVIHSEEDRSRMDISTSNLHHFVNQFVLPTPAIGTDQTIPSVAHNPPSAVDGLLALFFLVRIPPEQIPTDHSHLSETEKSDYKSLIDILGFLSAEQPDAFFRASANHLATCLLHSNPSPAFRLATIKSTLRDCGVFESLKEVAIGWLKDELLATTNNNPSADREQAAAKPDDSITGCTNEANILASPTLFDDDEELTSLIFPDEEDPASSSRFAPTQPHSLTHPIASLNLLFLLLTNKPLKSRYHESLTSKMTIATTSMSDDDDDDKTKRQPHLQAQKFLNRMRTYVDGRTDKNGSTGEKGEEEGRLALLALAVGRVVGALGG